ncbi:hypothetical protein BLOT_010987 [Blomia tropicalis]|nr:hypothetical protein BLOT_010987 [Blomia tropicalis]
MVNKVYNIKEDIFIILFDSNNRRCQIIQHRLNVIELSLPGFYYNDWSSQDRFKLPCQSTRYKVN